MPAHIDHAVPLAPLTTLEVGGRAREFVDLKAPEDFPDVAAHVASTGRPVRVIGSGSNVLVADEDYDGLIVRMATQGLAFSRDTSKAVKVTVSVQAGHDLQDLITHTIAEGLTGLECLTGIPGTVGATPIQNVGAYGQEISETLRTVDAWDWHTGRLVTLTRDQCRLGHRTSVFKHTTRWTILSITLALTRSPLSTPITYRAVAAAAGIALGERTTIEQAATAVYAVRKTKGMIIDPRDRDHRSVGSVFLSPIIDTAMAERLRAAGAPVNAFPDGTTRVSASWLIKDAGYALGQVLAPGVRISHHHFTLVADEGATATAFAEACAQVAARTLQATRVRLTAEPDLIGVLPTYSALCARGKGPDRPSRT